MDKNSYYFLALILVFTIHIIPCMANDEIGRETVAGHVIILKTGDITAENADAIVNAANAQLQAGAGVCGAIRKAAGPAVFKECQKILQNEGVSSIPVGEARLTGPGLLASIGVKGIIHAVGPQGLNEEKLRSAYRNSLILAENAGFSSIAFPSISTGIYGYPVENAAITALDEVRLFLEGDISHIQEVRFIFLDPNLTGDETAFIYKDLLNE